MITRSLVDVIESIATSDGAGVQLRRSVGSRRGLYVDPFLMLDEFYSDDPMTTSPVFPRTRIAASRPSPTCSMATCGTKITSAIAVTLGPAACSG